ncbi:MAG: hypothetical protein JWL65_7083 [Gammaproteobacteria bacterium]|jgi:CheY-like chemotaxis protein|nr:hypothetical protein [Gammaproteobacteria bacterium]
MQTNIARAGDYDQACAAGNTRTAILIVDDDTTARLTLSAMISNEDEYRVFLGSGAAEARERLPLIEPDIIVCVAPKPINAPKATGDGLRCRQDAPAVSESDA